MMRAQPFSRPLRIGTRANPLALAQAGVVAALLEAYGGVDRHAIEVVPPVRKGDRLDRPPLLELGARVFLRLSSNRCFWLVN